MQNCRAVLPYALLLCRLATVPPNGDILGNETIITELRQAMLTQEAEKVAHFCNFKR